MSYYTGINQLINKKTGVSKIKIDNWSGNVIKCPRHSINELKDIDTPCIYILLGDNLAYIGEAENIHTRIKQHEKNKDFWNVSLIFTESILTKAHVKYLEHELYNLSVSANRMQLVNSNIPTKAKLPEQGIHHMNKFLENISDVLLAIGIPLLTKLIPNKIIEQTKPILDDFLTLKHKSLKATGLQTIDGFVVLSGSEFILNNNNSSFKERDSRTKKRLDLIETGKLIESNDKTKLISTCDIIFNSPNEACCIILKASRNGKDYWLNNKGLSISDIDKQD